MDRPFDLRIKSFEKGFLLLEDDGLGVVENLDPPPDTFEQI
jgi:hypothetical protein